MHRRLRELDRLDAGGVTRSGGIARRLQLVALAVSVGTLGTLAFGYQNPDALPTVFVDGILGRGSAAAGSVDGGSYRYLLTQPGNPAVPVAYSSCRPIELVVDDRRAPAGASEILAEAAHEISVATGLDLRIVGTSTTDVVAFRRDRALRREVAPGLVTWTTPEEDPGLAGDVAGLGGSVPDGYGATGRQVYVSGTVSLDAPQLTEVLRGPTGRLQIRAIVMHELGHLVGLTHVADRRELMYEDNVGQLDLGPGDRAGLARLGRGPCLPPR